MALTFIILCGFGGLRTDGGFSQINYLKNIFNRLQLLKQKHEVLGEIYTPEPSIFRGEFILPYDNGAQKTPLDIIKNTTILTIDYLENIKQYAQKTSLKTAIYGMMDEFYKITIGTYPQR